MDGFLSFYKYFNNSERELQCHVLNRKEYDCSNSENIYSFTEILTVKRRLQNTSHNSEIAEKNEAVMMPLHRKQEYEKFSYYQSEIDNSFPLYKI